MLLVLVVISLGGTLETSSLCLFHEHDENSRRLAWRELRRATGRRDGDSESITIQKLYLPEGRGKIT
jgi:hypothetical protein